MSPARRGRKPRRHLLSVGVDHFARAGGFDLEEAPFETYADLPFAPAMVKRLASCLSNQGYVTDTPGALSSVDLGHAVSEAVDTLDTRDSLIVHVISHGVIGTSGSLYVLGQEGATDRTTDVDAWIRSVVDGADTPQTLFLLDLCSAGLAARLNWHLNVPTDLDRAWVLGASESHAAAFNGRFTEATAAVLATVGEAHGKLDIDASLAHIPLLTVAREIRRTVRDLADKADGIHQRVVGSLVDITDDVPSTRFFPNPRYVDRNSSRQVAAVNVGAVPFIDPPTSGNTHAAGTTGLRTIPLEVDELVGARHFREKGSGHGVIAAETQLGLFSGRGPQLNELKTWIDGRDPAQVTLRVVAGSPGVGKSALLGVLVCAAHPDLRASTREVWSQVSACPYENGYFAAVHARQRTSAFVLESVAAQLGKSSASDPVSLGSLSEALRGDPRQATVVIDALDEAVDPLDVVDRVVRPLVAVTRADGSPACRVLVATRPWEQFDDLIAEARERRALTDLDTVPADVLAYDLEQYVRNILMTHPTYDTPPFAAARAAFAASLAASLTHARSDSGERWGEFLVAGLYAHRVIIEKELEQDAQTASALGSAVPPDLPSVLEMQLAAAASDWMRPVLIAIAFGLGEGIPARLIAHVASAFRDGRPARSSPSQSEVAEVLDEAKFYLRQATDADGMILYRLFHQGLADHLRADAWSGVEPGTLERLIYHALRRSLTPSGIPETPHGLEGLDEGIALKLRRGSLDWDTAEPYVRRHLLAHAAAAGESEDLVTDVEFLVRVDPDQVDLLIEEQVARDREPPAELAAFLAARPGLEGVGVSQRRRLVALEAVRLHQPLLAARLTGAQMAEGSLLVPLWAQGTVRPREKPVVEAPVLQTPPLRVVAGAADGSLQVLQSPSGSFELDRTGSPVTALATALGVDAHRAVTTHRDGTVRVWDLGLGTLLHVIETGASGTVSSCAVVNGTGGANTIVTAGEDRIVSRWDLETGRSLGEPLVGYMTGPLNAVAAARLDRGPFLVFGGREGKVVARLPESEDGFGWSARHGAVVRAIACRAKASSALVAVVGGSRLSVWRFSQDFAQLLAAEVRDAIAVTFVDDTSVCVLTRDALVFVAVAGESESQVLVMHGLVRPSGLAVTTVAGEPCMVVVTRSGRFKAWRVADRAVVAEGNLTDDALDLTAWAVVDDWVGALVPPPRQAPPVEGQPSDVCTVALGSGEQALLLGYGDGRVERRGLADGRVDFDAAGVGMPATQVCELEVSGTRLVAGFREEGVTFWDRAGAEVPLMAHGTASLLPRPDPAYDPRTCAILRRGRLTGATVTDAGSLAIGGEDAVQLEALGLGSGCTCVTAGVLDQRALLAVGRADGQIWLLDADTLAWLDSFPVDDPVDMLVLTSRHLIAKMPRSVVVFALAAGGLDA